MIGIYNYKKTDIFYIYPSEGKSDSVYIPFSIPLLAQKEKISETDIQKKEIQRAYKWLKDNNIKLKDVFDLAKMTNAVNFRDLIKDEKKHNKIL